MKIWNTIEEKYSGVKNIVTTTWNFLICGALFWFFIQLFHWSTLQDSDMHIARFVSPFACLFVGNIDIDYSHLLK